MLRQIRWLSRGSLAFLLVIVACSDDEPASQFDASDGGSDGATGAVPDATADAEAEAAARYTLESIGASGVISGVVIDDNGASPLAASIRVDGLDAAFATAADGSFFVGVPLGRLTVHIDAPGYVPLLVDLPSGTEAFPIEYRLVARSAPVTVPATGATVTAGDASLTFPDGAYAGDTSVAATWLDVTRVTSSGVRAQISDDTNAIRVLGVVDVDVATQPATAVTLKVPVPAGVAATSLFLYDRDATGKLVGPVAATSVASGYADFSVTHFSQKVIGQPVPIANAGYVVSSAKGAAGLTAGQSPPTGVKLSVDPAGFAEIIDPLGTIILLTGGSQTTLQVPAKAGDRLSGCDMELVPGAGGVEIHEGVVRPSLNKPTNPGAARFTVRSRPVVMGVRGTTLTTRTDVCPDTQRTLISTEVSEGSVDICADSERWTVTGGSRLVTCAGCPAAPTCCDDKNCASGCCAQSARPAAIACKPGTATDACGKNAGTCDSCGSGSCSNQQCSSPDAILYTAPSGQYIRILGADGAYVYLADDLGYLRIPKGGGKPLRFGSTWGYPTSGTLANGRIATLIGPGGTTPWLGVASTATLAPGFVFFHTTPSDPDAYSYSGELQDFGPIAMFGGTLYHPRKFSRGVNLDPDTCGGRNCNRFGIAAVIPGQSTFMACQWFDQASAIDRVIWPFATAQGVYFIRSGIEQTFQSFTTKRFLSFCPNVANGTLQDLSETTLADYFGWAANATTAYIADGANVDALKGTSRTRLRTFPTTVYWLALDGATLYVVRQKDSSGGAQIVEKLPTTGGSPTSVNVYGHSVNGAPVIDDKYMFVRAIGPSGNDILLRVPK